LSPSDAAAGTAASVRNFYAFSDKRSLVDTERSEGLVPRKIRFGDAAEKLIEAFLKDDRFLMVSPNDYNSLGVGTTQLYNEPVVYNRNRHGRHTLDGVSMISGCAPRCRRH
jgi:hypothetical protein